MSRLENWAVITLLQNPYQAPETVTKGLIGNIYNDSRFPDGKEIQTTKLVGVIGKIATTRSGTQYELGKVASEYEALYPNALERLQAQFQGKEN